MKRLIKRINHWKDCPGKREKINNSRNLKGDTTTDALWMKTPQGFKNSWPTNFKTSEKINFEFIENIELSDRADWKRNRPKWS